MKFDEAFIRIDVNLLTRNCPFAVLGELGLKRYLHILMTTDNKKGYTISGNKSFNKQVKYTSRKAFKSTEQILAEKQLISQRKLSIKLTATYPLNVPFENLETHNLYKNRSHPINNQWMSSTRLDYIMMPTSALAEALKMPLSMMLVYIKLYRYNSYEVFGGIDINAVHVKHNKLYVHKRLPFDLCLSESEVKTNILALQQSGVLELSPIKITPLKYGMFTNYISSPLGKNAQSKYKQLIPYYQYKSKEHCNE